MKRASRRAQAGMSLIEVLTALLIFSFGILGLVGLHARATQISVSAEDTNRAAILANELFTVIWLNKPVAPAVDPVLPAADLAAWQDRVSKPEVDGLPNGIGAVEIAGDLVQVTITWRPPSAASGTPDNRYTTQARIRW